MELVSCLHSGFQNFEVAPRFLKILCTPGSRSIKVLCFHVCLVIPLIILKELSLSDSYSGLFFSHT